MRISLQKKLTHTHERAQELSLTLTQLKLERFCFAAFSSLISSDSRSEEVSLRFRGKKIVKLIDKNMKNTLKVRI